MATSRYEWISITAEEASAMRTLATAATLGEKAFELITWVGPLIHGGAKAPKEVVLKTLSKSIDIFLQENDREKYPLENYLKFIETLPQSIRQEVFSLFQEMNTPKVLSKGVETSIDSPTTSDGKQKPSMHDKKLKPAERGLGADFDYSGDYGACPIDHPGMSIKPELRGKVAPKKFYYERLINALTRGINSESVYGYISSSRQDQHCECLSYRTFGTLSFIALPEWFEARGFTFIPLLYRDIQKMNEDKNWYIGRSMEETIAYIFENENLIKTTDYSDLYNNSCPKLDKISPHSANNKPSILEEQLKHFAENIVKDGKVRPFYFIDDTDSHVRSVCYHFGSNPEKIPEGVELHVIHDAQGSENNLGFFCYGRSFVSPNGIFSRTGGREPTPEEADLLASIQKLECPEKTSVAETKKVSDSKESTEPDPKDSTPENSDLFTYAGNKDWQKVQELLESRKFGVNDKDEASGSLSTLLHYAVGQGNLEVVQKLVERGRADVNPINQQKKTPLDHCDRSKHPEIEKYLLSNGAKKAKDLLPTYPEEVNTTSTSPQLSLKDQEPKPPTLFRLAADREWEQVEGALKCGKMDVNAKNPLVDSYTLLHYAVVQENLDAVKMLVGMGAKVNLKNTVNRAPLDYCTTLEHEAIKQYLEQAAKLGSRINDSKQITEKNSPPNGPPPVKLINDPIQTANNDSCYKSFFRFWAYRTPAEKAAIEVVALAAVEGVACLCLLFSMDQKFFSHAGNYGTVSGINDALKTNVGMTTFSTIALAGLIVIGMLYLYNRNTAKKADLGAGAIEVPSKKVPPG